MRANILRACKGLPPQSVRIKNHRELKTQLEVACKLYNTPSKSTKQAHDKKELTRLKTLSSELCTPSCVANRRVYQARKRFLEGLAKNPSFVFDLSTIQLEAL